MKKNHRLRQISLSFALICCLNFLFAFHADANSDTTIFRSVDINKEVRQFPNLVGYLNTSLQKAPASALAGLVKKEYGTPEIMRCWLNLDEMWDYRTRKYNFDFKIGVDKYKDIKEKHRETWKWQVESEINYYDYLSNLSSNSKEIMLTIRRYEKDINTGGLPVSMKDWKMIFKAGLKHYKMKFPNIRYVEVCNEYELKGFMDGTNDQYYKFYKSGYEAVNEVNDELKLKGKNRILVGGPVTTGNSLPRIEALAENFVKDKNPTKTMDFVSWHEYTKPIGETAHRAHAVKAILKKYGLNEFMPMFITEHDPFHYDKDSDERHYSNASTLVKSLYFTSLYSPDIKVFPWVLYHNDTVQTRFMWFKGPNTKATGEEQLKMLPIGVSMKLLSKHKGQEIKVQNDIDQDNIVLVSKNSNNLFVQAVNFSSTRPVRIILNGLKGKIKSSYTLKKYVLDRTNNNLLENHQYAGRLVALEIREYHIYDDNSLILQHDGIEKYGTVFWEISWN